MFPVMNRGEMRGMPGDHDRFGTPNELAEFADTDFVGLWQGVMQRLLAIPEYVTKFNNAFPGTATSALGFQHAATAIAAFETKALTRTDSPFDRYLQHDDAALTSEEKRGALLFFGDKARCASCHGGPLLGGQNFANAGVRSEEHTSELQSPCNLVCRLLLEKKKQDILALSVRA